MSLMSLLSRDQAPEHLRLPSMLTGYRPKLSFLESLRSLFYLHNQWGNAWVFIVQIPVSIYFYCKSSSTDHAFDASALLLASCLIHTPVSIAYHVFMSVGADVRCRLKRADYACIFVMINLITVAIGWHPFSNGRYNKHIQYTQVAATVLLSIASYASTSRTSSRMTRMTRALLVGAVVLSALSPIAFAVHRFWGLVACASLFFGGTVWALHFPESVVPVVFDLHMNSHALMHVAIVVAHVSFYEFIDANVANVANVVNVATVA